MKAVRLIPPGGLDALTMVELDDPGAIRVRLHASSLNEHDYVVATRKTPPPGDLIPMSDGAGLVEAGGGDGVEFQPGDRVVSGFFPAGRMGRRRSATSRRPPATAMRAMSWSRPPHDSPVRRTVTAMPRPRRSPPPASPLGARW